MISGFPTFGRICLGALVAFSALARAHVPAAAAHVEASGQTAKFLSPDPLGLDGGANLYAYADGDPVNRADPLGLCAGSVGSVRSSWERREALANAVRTGFRALGAVALLAAPGPEEFLLGAALKVAGRAATAVARVSGAAADFARGAGLVRAARPAPILARPGAVPMATGVARAAKSPGVKYIGKMDDLKGIPRSQTLLDDLPDLGSAKANYYQNSSVLRKALRDGYEIRDASAYRPNWSPDPTLLRPDRTVGQSFLGAERLILDNKGLILDSSGTYVPR